MSLYEEQVLFRRLRQLAERDALDAPLRRLYRKLSLRKTKRSIGQEPFNFDRLVAKLSGREWSCPVSSETKVVSISNVLDRFQRDSPASATSQTRLNISFRMRLFGTPDDHIPQPVVSPYTGRFVRIIDFVFLHFRHSRFVLTDRTLKPFIRRDYESRPLKLRLLEEIRSKCSCPEIRGAARKPIDYVYVQPHHIPVINAICREFFWAGIDGGWGQMIRVEPFHSY